MADLRDHVRVVITFCLVLGFAVAVVRLEHLIASDFWIYFRGADFRVELRARMRAPRRRRQLGTAAGRWDVYRAVGGGASPWKYSIFFGIQASKLSYWVSRSRGLAKAALWMVRFVWKFYTFPLVVVGLLLLFLWTYETPLQLHLHLLLAIMVALAMSAWAVAIAVVLAIAQMGALVHYHLSWPPRELDEQRPAREVMFVFGSGLIAWVALFGLTIVVGAGLDGYENFSRDGGFGHVVARAAEISLRGLFGNWANTANGYGIFANFVVFATMIAYLLFVVGALWLGAANAKRQHTGRRH